MFNIQKHLRHAVLALGLAAASLTAAASVLPTYRVSVADTATADIASIDVIFSTVSVAAPVTASLFHFTGTPLVELDRWGAVSDTAGVYSIGNDGSYNDLYFGVDGPFSFDLKFSEDFLSFNNESNNNGYFSIVLWDSIGNVIGNEGGELQLSLTNTGIDPIRTSALVSFTEVTDAAVPEPADWALMLTGLVFVVYMARKNGRANMRATAEA